jgi:hypothetical protein
MRAVEITEDGHVVARFEELPSGGWIDTGEGEGGTEPTDQADAYATETLLDELAAVLT